MRHEELMKMSSDRKSEFKSRLEFHFLQEDLKLILLIQNCLAATPDTPYEIGLTEIRGLNEANLTVLMPGIAKALEKD